MRIFVSLFLVFVIVVCPSTFAAGLRLSQDSSSHPTAALKKYKATITRKDDRNNTKTFTDYCEATSLFEAQKVFEGRYPGARISGVTEVK